MLKRKPIKILFENETEEKAFYNWITSDNESESPGVIKAKELLAQAREFNSKDRSERIIYVKAEEGNLESSAFKGIRSSVAHSVKGPRIRKALTGGKYVASAKVGKSLKVKGAKGKHISRRDVTGIIMRKENK